MKTAAFDLETFKKPGVVGVSDNGRRWRYVRTDTSPQSSAFPIVVEFAGGGPFGMFTHGNVNAHGHASCCGHACITSLEVSGFDLGAFLKGQHAVDRGGREWKFEGRDTGRVGITHPLQIARAGVHAPTRLALNLNSVTELGVSSLCCEPSAYDLVDMVGEIPKKQEVLEKLPDMVGEIPKEQEVLEKLPDMVLEAGKSYTSAAGDRVQILFTERKSHNGHWPVIGLVFRTSGSGRPVTDTVYYSPSGVPASGQGSPRLIVGPWVEPPFKLEVGKSYVDVHGCRVDILRDDYYNGVDKTKNFLGMRHLVNRTAHVVCGYDAKGLPERISAGITGPWKG